MGNFNRGRSSGGGDFRRGGFGGDRGSDRPVIMHQAVCDNCRKDCQVPFRPTSGKPVFCSNCFENNRNSDSRGSEGRSFSTKGGPASGWEDRQMFSAVCDNCGKDCQVPFRPTTGKPVFCSNCFGEKKGAGSSDNGQSQPQFKEQFEALNSKLDRILQLLDSNTVLEVQKESDPEPQEQVTAPEKVKVAKKKSPKKKA